MAINYVDGHDFIQINNPIAHIDDSIITEITWLIIGTDYMHTYWNIINVFARVFVVHQTCKK